MFENGIKKEKKMFFFFVASVGERKKILSPHEESNLRPSDFRAPMLYH